MKIALLYGASGLAARGSLEIEGYRDDPRGLTGSEYGAIRLYELLDQMGHDVTFCVACPPPEGESFDLAIALNEPDLLRFVDAKFRVCEFWVNGFTHCKVGFDQFCDLFVSPSDPHLRMALETWRDVEQTPAGCQGSYEAAREKWVALPLGHDVTKRGPKVSGRVIHLSSPDRGLHRLLEMWPSIKESVPHATLRVFYRLQPWIDQLKAAPIYRPVERNRRRALYIEDALRRLEESGGLESWGVEVCDSVSRNRIDQELAEAEVMAYPCETLSWSEGFSCSTLEACAAGCAVVVTDCDALGDVYRTIGPVPVGNWQLFEDNVVYELNLARERVRTHRVRVGQKLAEPLTWLRHVERLMEEVQCRMK